MLKSDEVAVYDNHFNDNNGDGDDDKNNDKIDDDGNDNIELYINSAAAAADDDVYIHDDYI